MTSLRKKKRKQVTIMVEEEILMDSISEMRISAIDNHLVSRLLEESVDLMYSLDGKGSMLTVMIAVRVS
jgi:hypothetical protein